MFWGRFNLGARNSVLASEDGKFGASVQQGTSSQISHSSL